MVITSIPWLFSIFTYTFQISNNYPESEYKDNLNKLIYDTLLDTTLSKTEHFKLNFEGNIRVNYFISEDSLPLLQNTFKSLQEEKISYDDYLNKIINDLYRNLHILYITTPYNIYCYTTFKDDLLDAFNNSFKPGIPYEQQFETITTELSFYYNIPIIKLFYQFTQPYKIGDFKCTYSIKLESF